MINLNQIELGDKIYTPDGIFEVIGVYERKEVGYKRVGLNDNKGTILFGSAGKTVSNTHGWYKVAKTIINITKYPPMEIHMQNKEPVK